MKYQIPQTVFIQEIDDEIILLDTITQEYFSLNEVGKNIIDLISENLTKDEMVEELSKAADIPMPKIGISETNVPNAFAYGRSKHSGRICVTRGILGVVNRDELKAVLGHEIGHLKHNDMAITTLVSAIPMICYYVALSTLFSHDSQNGGTAILGLIAMACYALGQLIVLFIR